MISKYSTDSEFCKCYTDRNHKHIALLRKASSSYIFCKDFLWLKPLQEGCQPVTRATTDNQSRMHKWKAVTYKLDTRKDNHLWDLSLGNMKRKYMPANERHVKIKLDPIWYKTKCSFYFPVELVYIPKRRTSPLSNRDIEIRKIRLLSQSCTA